MSFKAYECEFCGKDSFTSQRGLTQHQQRNALCLHKLRAQDIRKTGYHTADKGMLYTGIINQSTRNVRSDAKEPDHVALDNCAGKQNRCSNKNIDQSSVSCGKTSQSGGSNETMEADDVA